YDYYWSEGSEGPMLTGVDPGSYSLTVVDANGCEAILEDIKLKEKTGAIVLDTFLVNGISCAGNSDASMMAAISNGTGDYLYHFTPTYIVNTGADTVSRSGLAHSPEYSVTITDIGSGCSVESEQVNLTPPLPLTISQDSFDLAICFGGNDGAIFVTPSGGTPEYSYQWFDGSGEMVSETEDLQQVPSDVYTLILTDGNGCTLTVIDSSVVDQNPLIVNDTTIISNVQCRGDSTGIIDITVSGGAPPFTYEWSYGEVTSEDLIGVPFGVYSVTVTDSDTCRAIFPFFSVSQPATSIEVVEQLIQNPLCFGGMDGMITAAFTGGGPPYNYYWTQGGEIIPGEIEPELDNVGGGVYELIVTDTMDCEEVFEFEVVEPEFLSLNLVANPPNPPENNGSVTAIVDGGTPGYTYLWSTGDTTMVIEINEEATYIVTVVDQNGCEIMDSTMVVPTIHIPDPVTSFKHYPNPVNEVLFIEVTLEYAATLDVELFTATGKSVGNKQWKAFKNGKLTWDVKSLPSGFYVLKTKVNGVVKRISQVVLME
ncbi:MAG: T9SS C-terminal target domain-containing protein, partial [Bacteroidetes bacterium]